MAPTRRVLRSSGVAPKSPVVRRSARISDLACENESDSEIDSDGDGSDYERVARAHSGRAIRNSSDRVLRSAPLTKKRKISPLPSRVRYASQPRTRQSTQKKCKSNMRPALSSPQTTPQSSPMKAKRTARHSTDIASEHIIIQSEGRIPPWQTLPYYVLVQIFTYASHPLYDDKFWPQPSIAFLLQMSRLCRAFAEPALAVLYHSPPLLPSHRAHGLSHSLQSTAKPKLFRYNQKIRRLEVEVSQTLALACPGSGYLDICALVAQTPQLQDLELFHIDDRPPYRSTGQKRVNWYYPYDLFDVLCHKQIRLRSWRWNTRMLQPGLQGLELLELTHKKLPFQTLERLAFTNFNTTPQRAKKDDSDDNGDSVTNEEQVALSLSNLPKLKVLLFESCTIVNQDFLPLLPRTLTTLSITNCPNLTAEVLGAFLVTHGYHLQELVLNHNRSLNLSFLPELAESCPHLQVFKMDFKYFNKFFSYNDSEPNFEKLISQHEVPTWPSSLQCIELLHLRKWDLETAQMFFRSLLNAAPQLMNLHKLVLKAILKTGWRDRASFRDDWIRNFQHVFLRKIEAVNIELQSLMRWRAYKAKLAVESELSAIALDDEANEDVVLPVPQRRSFRGIVVGTSTEQPHPQAPNRRSYRLVSSRAVSLESDNFKGNVQVIIPPKETTEALDFVTPTRRVGTPRMTRGRARQGELEQLKSSFERASLKRRRSEQDGESEDDEFSEEEVSSREDRGRRSGLKRNGTGKKSDKEKELPVQGMCSIVDIRIDNMRPSEDQYVEDDFLDEEASGDEEWDGEDRFANADGYAW